MVTGDSGWGDLGDLARPADLESESLVDSGSFSSTPASEQGVLLSGIQTPSPGGQQWPKCGHRGARGLGST